MEVLAVSDLFQHRYYRINTMVLKLTGQWPFHETRTRFAIGTVVLFILASEMVPQTVAIVKHLDDWDYLIDCVTPWTFIGVFFSKYFCSTVNSKKMMKLLNHIHSDWDVLARDRDADILHEHAEWGRKLTIVYAIVAYITCILFATQPVVPKIIDVFLRNGTELGEFPLPVDYFFIDEQEYYFFVVIHCCLSMALAFTIVIAHDTLLIVYVQHACGLYAVLGQKLARIGKETHKISHASDQPDIDFDDLASCIARHNEAIEYAKVIEATYSWCFFFVVGFNMFLITFAGLQVVVTSITPQETVKFAVSTFVAALLLYAECCLSQSLMDYSIIIRYYILNSDWYKLPLKVQKILLLVIMRSNIPCTITAGKVCVMSIETFKVVMKTSLSYFSLLRSK